MKCLLIVALFSTRLVAYGSETSDWRRIPAVPLYTVPEVRPIGKYLHVAGAALRMGQTNWMTLSRDCNYSGRYGICGFPDQEPSPIPMSLLDLDSGARELPILGFTEALGDAAFTLRKVPEGEESRDAYLLSCEGVSSCPRSVVTEQGVGISAVTEGELGLMFFSTHDSLQPDGSVAKAWRFTGYASCPKGCRGPTPPASRPLGQSQIGTVGEVVWLLERSGLKTAYWKSLDFGRTWSLAPSNPFSNEPILSGPDTPLATSCPTSQNALRICTSADGGATWDSSHSAPARMNRLLYVGSQVLGYDLTSSEGIRVFGSSDHGATWRLLRTEAIGALSTAANVLPTRSGGLLIHSPSSVRYIETPESPWIAPDLGRFHEAPFKVRASPDAVYLAQIGWKFGYEGLSLFRYREKSWTVVQESVEDFEIVSGHLVTMSSRYLFREPDPDQPYVATGYQTQVVTLTREVSPGSWDTILTHALPERPCAAGYKGMGISCPDSRALLESDGGTGLQIIQQGKWVQRDSVGIHSTDRGISWLAGKAPFSPLPPIDPEVVRIDSSYDLLVKGGLGNPLATKPRTKPGIALRERQLALELPGPETVQIQVLTPNGRILQILPDREYAAGRHDVSLPTGKGLCLVRIRIGDETTTLRRVSP